MLNYYRPIQDTKGYTYSLDMLRFNFSLFYNKTDDFNKLIQIFGYQKGCDFKYYFGHNSYGYKHMWNLTIETDDGQKGSFAMGLDLHGSKENERNGFIEFNPNKLMHLNEFYLFFSKFRELCSHLVLVRYDVAIDIPLPRNMIKMVRTRNCSYEYLTEEEKTEKERLCSF